MNHCHHKHLYNNKSNNNNNFHDCRFYRLNEMIQHLQSERQKLLDDCKALEQTNESLQVLLLISNDIKSYKLFYL